MNFEEKNPAQFSLDVPGATGIPFRIVVDFDRKDYQGRQTGKVRVYDRRFADHPDRSISPDFTDDGQFITETIPGDLSFHASEWMMRADIPEWRIHASVMEFVSDWAHSVMHAYAKSAGMVWSDDGDMWDTYHLIPLPAPVEPAELDDGCHALFTDD